MKTLSKTLLGLAMASIVSTASAGTVSLTAAYGQTDADAAAAAFAAGSYGGVTETFDDSFTSITNQANQEAGATSAQATWQNAGSAFETRVGTFTMTSENTASNGNVRNDLLMIENSDTGEFGRQKAYTSNWLDSNDAKQVTWEILDGYNALGFYLSDANDNGAKLRFIFDDGSASATTLDFKINRSNGNIAYITLVSDTIFSSVELRFDNNTNSADGWGIDNVTLAKVPEPGTLALLGLGLFGLTAARRRMNAA
jgi:hypothetical protein